MRFVRTFDWRFMLTFALTLLVGWLLWSASVESRAKDEQIESLISAADQAQRAAAHDRRVAAEERRLARIDRRRANWNQQALLKFTERLADRNRAVLTFLRENGIELPAPLVREIPAPVLRRPVTSDGGGGGSGSGGKAGGGGATSPGKSGTAPGQNKGKGKPVKKPGKGKGR